MASSMPGVFPDAPGLPDTDASTARVQRAQYGAERVLKRATDICVASVVLIAMLPILLMIAVLVRSRIGGAVLVAQPRIGRDGKIFDCYTFRTTVPGGGKLIGARSADRHDAVAEVLAPSKFESDPSAKLLARILCQSRLDELPQLYNVLAGHMSCVEPRPNGPE